METNDYPVFLEWLSDVAECFQPAPALDRVAPLYFHHLQAFDIAIVQEAFSMALENCRFFPKIAELRELAKAISRTRFKAERAQERQCKHLGQEAEALASGGEGQANAAKIVAMLVNGTSMDAVADPEPHARPRVLHQAYREPTKDHAARRQDLRDQLAQVQREEEETAIHG